jgi:glycosyl transferase, family 25
MKKILSSFDHAFVINLDEDFERMDQMRERLNLLGIDFERFAAAHASPAERANIHPHLPPALLGCARSHLSLLRLIQERGYDSCLILEDDVMLRDDTQQVMQTISAELDEVPWDVFYLGLHLVRAGARLGPHLGRVKSGFHAHAYAVKHSSLERLTRVIEQRLIEQIHAFDDFYDESLLKIFSIPILAIQKPQFSYTTGRYTDRLAQYFTTFDGDEFTNHCNELRATESNWRILVEALKRYTSARLHLASSPLTIAARSFADALAVWPATEPTSPFSRVCERWRGELESPGSSDRQLMRACQEMDRAMRQYVLEFTHH